MRDKIWTLLLAAWCAAAIFSCTSSAKKEQPAIEPAGQELPAQPAPPISPIDTPPLESVENEATEEPGEVEPAAEDATTQPDADRYYSLGQSLYNTGHYQDAVIAFKETLAIEGQRDEAHFDLARTYLVLDDLDAAQNEYKILLKSDPDMADALRNEAINIVSLNKAYKLIVQVGAFRHLNNATYLVDTLKEDYLFVFMEKTDRLYKVLIHGIKTMADGNALMNEIKTKHDLHPFLIISE